MNRNLSLLSVIILLSNTIYGTQQPTSFSKNAEEWRKLEEQIGSNKNTTIIDKNKMLDEDQKEWNRLFDDKNLTRQERNTIFSLRCIKCRNETEGTLDNLFYANENIAKQDVRKQRVLCIAQIAQAKAEWAYEKYATSKQKFSSKTQEDIGKQVYKAVYDNAQSRKRGSLTFLVNGKLEENIRNIVDETKKEIYEIYPHENGPRQQETLNNASGGRQIREANCCVCSEPFEELGQRVNLACRHCICPTCLKESKYDYSNNTCPLCREPISDADFPKDYLESYINS